MIRFFILFTLFMVCFTQAQTMGTMTDQRDGQTYKTVAYKNVLLGESVVWMAQNLNYKTTNSFAYDNEVNNRKNLGLLYTWKAATIACPKGWHLPSGKEWNILINYFGGTSKAGKALKSKKDWSGNIINNNKSGFTALPAGFYYWYSESFLGLEENAVFWSSLTTIDNSALAITIMLNYKNSKVVISDDSDKKHAMSCRCVKN